MTSLMFSMPSREILTTKFVISISNMVCSSICCAYVNAGDVVRIQPNHLSFTNIEALPDIYGFHAKAVKGDMYVNIFQLTGASTGQNLFSSVLTVCPKSYFDL